jgi:hypothetical protein
MRVPSVGWAFFGLAVIVLAGYVLNRGIYIGSDTRPARIAVADGINKTVYRKYCRFLHFTGVREDWMAGQSTEEEADKNLCSMFDRISN